MSNRTVMRKGLPLFHILFDGVNTSKIKTYTRLHSLCVVQKFKSTCVNYRFFSIHITGASCISRKNDIPLPRYSFGASINICRTFVTLCPKALNVGGGYKLSHTSIRSVTKIDEEETNDWIKKINHDFESIGVSSDVHEEEVDKYSNLKPEGNDKFKSAGLLESKIIPNTNVANDFPAVENVQYHNSPGQWEENLSDDDIEYEDFTEANEFFGVNEVHYEEIAEREHPISFQHGKNGVFDIHDLIKVLEHENAFDICVMKVPADLHYVDFMVVVTGKSTRHLKAIAEYVRWLYKRRVPGDEKIPKIEGKNSNDWLALDLGNIAVHLFLQETRQYYDLETLWTVGKEYDDMVSKQNEEDPFDLWFSDNSSDDNEFQGRNVALDINQNGLDNTAVK